MKNIIGFAFIALTVALVPAFAENEQPKANCELRLVSNAGAGEAFLAIFTNSQEECLAKSDNSVQARFRDSNGSVVGKRGGAGPQP